MANVKISNLTAASTPLAGTEVLPVVQSGATVKASIANVQTATYSGGTANGVAYLNGSKVLTTGSALVFDGTNLGLGVTPSAWTSNQWSVFEGAYGGALAFYKASNVPVTVLTSNAYNDGSWKYKTTDPALQYEMDGNGGTYKWYQAASGTAGNAITFTQAMTLDASGNLGIGTSSPSTKLHVASSGTTTYSRVDSSAYRIYVGAEGDGNAIYTQTLAGAAALLRFYVGASTQAMTLDASGNLMVGATSSSAIANKNIDVNGTGDAAFVVRVGGTTTSYLYSTAGQTILGTVGAIPITFNPNGTEAARITSSGYFKASNTGSYIGSTGTYHELVNDSQTSPSAFIRNSSASFSSTVLAVTSGNTTTNNTFYFLDCNNGTPTTKFRIADSGNVTNTNNSYGAISDIKLKENIVDATPKLEKLNQVRVVNYNFIGDQQKQLGVVAQELEQVFPGMIDESPDKDANGNDLGTTTKSVKYSVFVPMLIKAIQEQQALITTLTARITALEGA